MAGGVPCEVDKATIMWTTKERSPWNFMPPLMLEPTDDWDGQLTDVISTHVYPGRHTRQFVMRTYLSLT